MTLSSLTSASNSVPSLQPASLIFSGGITTTNFGYTILPDFLDICFCNFIRIDMVVKPYKLVGTDKYLYYRYLLYDMPNMRKERGLQIAKAYKITKKDDYFIVPSQRESNKRYTVRIGKEVSCNCPDFAKRGEEIGKCKHIFAVEICYSSQKDNYGNTIATQTTKITYSQEWSAYNKSQTTEKEMLMKLLNDLCQGIEQPDYVFGRPSIMLRDVVFCSVFKVFSTFSGRRFSTDMREAEGKGYITKAPHYNTVFKYFQKPELTPILQKFIEITSLPLKSIETDFAVDSSGFSTGMFSRWFDSKYRSGKEERMWLKAHIMVGTKTNTITAIKITDGNISDAPQFSELVRETAENFDIKEVSADKGYSSRENIRTVQDVGGTPFIMFRKNANPKRMGSFLWKKMYHYFMMNQEEFMEHYHKRSNVETTFSMIKRKFGTNVRSKTKTAQINEILCKVLCHNICVVIQEMNELGIEARF